LVESFSFVLVSCFAIVDSSFVGVID
jgi:hypothetical protein